MLTNNNFSVVFAIYGFISCLLISFISFFVNIINSKTEMLFLSFGFYKHFLNLYFKNFFKSLLLIYQLSINRKSFNPSIHKVQIKDNYNFNESLLMATFNLSVGLLSIGTEDRHILVHAIHEDFFYDFDILKNIISLNNINDDNLI